MTQKVVNLSVKEKEVEVKAGDFLKRGDALYMVAFVRGHKEKNHFESMVDKALYEDRNSPLRYAPSYARHRETQFKRYALINVETGENLFEKEVGLNKLRRFIGEDSTFIPVEQITFTES
jgi:hypothetical protein